MLENSNRTLNASSSNNGNIVLKIGIKDSLNITANSSPTSNCQLSGIANFNEIIDNLSVIELTFYLNKILTTGNYIKLLIFTNKYREIKIIEAFKNVNNKKILLQEHIKVKNKNQYIYLLKTK